MQHLNETQRYTIYRMRKDKKTQAEIARAIGVSQATVSKEMKGVQWGEMYNKHRDDPYKESELRARVRELMKDSDVKNKSGIYWYVMDGDERHLDIRAFDDNTKREVYERQNGICAICGNHLNRADGSRSYQALVRWRSHGSRELSNALQGVQSTEEREVGRTSPRRLESAFVGAEKRTIFAPQSKHKQPCAEKPYIQ